jgi:VIT1/CCC1 family predicted Fe2+/Mn2+ transporter
MSQYQHYRNAQELEEHIRKFHKSNPFSNYLQEIVYGGSDGIVTTLAVVSGFAGANNSDLGLTTTLVLLFGLANLFADATSMGLGNFLSVRSENAVTKRQRRKQAQQICNNKSQALTETQFLLTQKGYRDDDAKIMADIISKNESYWLDFTMAEELGTNKNSKENLAISSLFTFFSFVVFGFMPIIPYLIDSLTNQYFYSGLSALLSLSLLGFVRRFFTRESIIRSIGETVIVGGVSASVAYSVGLIFGG